MEQDNSSTPDYNSEDKSRNKRLDKKYAGHSFLQGIIYVAGFIWETLKIVIFALAIVIPVRYYLIQPFFVRGASMTPNFEDGQYLIIDEISYRFSEPQRGEVIVFRYPADPSQYFIKRIVGLPNETVELKNNQIIIYNVNFPEGQVLDESAYFLGSMHTNGEVKFVLGNEDYFVLGDNRRASSDSRQWGALAKEYIIGRVWLRAWPIKTAEIF